MPLTDILAILMHFTISCRTGVPLRRFVSSQHCFILNLCSCIEKRLVCDGRRDCNSQEDEDEKFCADYLCSGRFYCRSNNYCIHPSQKCDGTRDCADGADEKDCPKREGQALDYFNPSSNKRLNKRGRDYYDQTPNQVSCWKNITLLVNTAS